MRTAFINQLIVEARQNKDIFLVVGDLGFSVVEPFIEEFPDRFLNAGVAEQNMTGIAAGLAMEGYNVFTYSIGNFPTMRTYEQIRYDVCYHNLSVKIVSVGGGYAYGPLGTSHHATEDFGIMRVLPNMIVTAPADPHEAKAITTLLCNHRGPGFLRLGKAGEPNLHPKAVELNIGQALYIKEGEGSLYIATGSILKDVIAHVNANDPKAGIASFPFVKPLDHAFITDAAKKYTNWISLEEHQSNCGFGSAILECLNDLYNYQTIPNMPRLKRIAIPDLFIGYAGTQEFLRKEAGLIL